MKKINAEVIQIEKTTRQQKNTFDVEGMQTPPYDLNMLAEIYYYNGYHSKCINLKAIISSGLGYEITGSNKNKFLEFTEKHAEQTGRTFLETLISFQTDFEIFGNAYFELSRGAKKDENSIYHLPAIEVKLSYKDGIVYAVQGDTGNEVYFNPLGKIKQGVSEYIMLKNYNPQSRYYGMPEYFGCLSSILLDRNAIEYNINKFNNNAIPESVIIVKGASLGEEAKFKIKDFFTSNVKGINNAGRSLILEAEDEDCGIEIVKLAGEVQDASFSKLRIDSRDEIIATHGVPKRLLGIAEPGGLGGSNESKNQLKIFQDCVIEPRQRRLEFLLNEMLINKALGITNCRLKLNKLHIENPEADAKYYDILIKNGILTIDEAREELGY